VIANRITEQLVVSRYRLAHRELALLLEPGRSFDVGKEERYGPKRPFTHDHLRQAASL
jgi:hypothetical protein